MRKVIQVAALQDNSVLAVCADGTLWHSTPGESHVFNWVAVQCPAEGNVLREPKTTEEQAEDLAQAGGRKMIIGRGLKHET